MRLILAIGVADLNEVFASGGGFGRREEAGGELAEVGEAFDEGKEFANGFAVEHEAARDEDGMGDGDAAAGTDVDFVGAASGVELAHALHFRAVEDGRQILGGDVPHRLAIEHVALAAGVDVAVVLDIHGTAP